MREALPPLSHDLTEVPGRIHSLETAGTVDGPGVRFVVFTTGCPLRCKYCHNPDAQHLKAGEATTVGAVMAELAPFASFYRAHGGLTVTGGEPLVQPDFTRALFQAAKLWGLTTALDTSGFLGARADDALLEVTDLVLLDIKSWDPETYRDVTGVALQPTLDFARRLAKRGTPLWLRFVLVPGLTDSDENVRGLATFARSLPNVDRIEVLPFHKMGEAKWRALGRSYQLFETPEPTADQIERVRALLEPQAVA
ncbi:pyruvate formate-lyase-activating protein [Algihabitans albus]|uniref:pyruvate formate-lyase-activating protein n=1 Tax=Algihabitans albus TaxID=2164067 RepID=UPI000E5D179B|nr:pyruvate formate-lyase-activating protein [Algihabitans albus]